MNAVEMLNCLLAGKKVRSKEWDVDSFRYIKNNQIFDHTNQQNNFTICYDSEYEEYIKPLCVEDFVIGFTFGFNHNSFIVVYVDNNIILAKYNNNHYETFMKSTFFSWKVLIIC